MSSLGAEAADEFCRACHTATGGNPLFVRELLAALRAARVAPSAAAASEVQAVGPAAVSRFVLHRLATLGPAGERAGADGRCARATTASCGSRPTCRA